jgi:hypothetical protein
MGRAFAVSMAINFVGYPFGAAIGGALVGYGVAVPLAVAVVFTTLAGILGAILLPRNAPPAATGGPVPEATPEPGGGRSP